MNKKISVSIKIIMLLMIISLAACSKITEKTVKNTPADLNPNQTIIDAGNNMDWIFGKNYTKWTPSGTDIEYAEKLITQCFDDQKRGTVNRLLNRKPEDYYRQFVGVINEKGEKIIWVNCFCDKEINFFKDWKTNIIMVADGGNCFFNLKINVDKNNYYDVMVNEMRNNS